jgi:molybdenum cofactor cytidylyltransferase
VIAGIILAAGESRRMGSPKALLEYRGETFSNRLVRVLSGVCDPVIMALAHQADLIRPQVRGRVRFVINPDPDRGQLSSLQIALAAVPSDAEAFMFTPVDCPAMEPETVALIAETFARRDPATEFVIPSYQGHHGHPVCGSRAMLTELLALPATGQARQVVHAHVSHTQYVDVEDAGILVDIDDPEAYRNLAGRTR